MTLPSCHYAFGAHKVPLSASTDPNERALSYQHMLCRTLNLHAVVAFVGAGCSAAFGYPTWEGFALEMIRRTRAVSPKDVERLDSFTTLLAKFDADKRPCPADQLTLFIAACKSILLETGKQELFATFIEELFSPSRADLEQAPHDNPYKELFALDIRRFVTTNYDVELERTLMRARNLEPDDSSGLKTILKAACIEPREGHKKTLRSFSQKQANYEQLALFALTQVRGMENAVFHCHGRYDDASSLIASESDYQNWYFRDDEEGRTFRQTIELLLGSNPLLFVGYGLGDDDLLRPLRHLNALDSRRRHSRPIFALVRLQPGDDVRDEVLYERYGVHVIPYYANDPSGPGHTAKLCAKIRAIAELWKADAEEWTQKPKARASVLADWPETAYIEHPCSTTVPIGRSDGVEDEVRQPGLIGLRGPTGSGKSLRLIRLMNSPDYDFQRRFYWNAHYATEFLPAFDDALAFFHAEDPQHSRHESLLHVLQEQRLLLIIDGCERFLHQSAASDSLVSYSASFNLLLTLLNAHALKSTVIIAGRILPAELVAAATPGGQTRVSRVYRLVSADLLLVPLFQGISAAGHHMLVTGLCSLLRGHNYGLRLAELYLEHQDGEAWQHLKTLNKRLAARPPIERLSEMVRLFIRSLDERHRDLYRLFLKRLARFVGPVGIETCKVCYEGAQKDAVAAAPPPLDQALTDLAGSALIFEMRHPGSGNQKGYCVHATTRSMLLSPRHGPTADALPDFGISGFTSGRIDAYPDPSHRPQIEGILNEIIKLGERAANGSDPRLAAALCIDAFALLRSTMAANTALRGSTGDAYGKYIEFGLRLVRLVKSICGANGCDTWTYCEYFDRKCIESPDVPLHISELAWIYNDFGLALSAEGLVRDAYSVWEQASEISRVMEHFHHGGAYRVEVLLNLTHAFIEMGRLRDARAYLRVAENNNKKLRDPDCEGRLMGFKAFLAHLGGNLPEADALYSASWCRLQRGNNLRAQSVFNKHHSDLKMALGDLEQADLLIRRSRALAEASVSPDLVAFARVSGGHLLALRRRHIDSRREYESLLGEAQRVGARKLEAECLATLSVLCLQEKDIEGARVRAMQALSLANELGLGLRLTHSMIVLGQATVKAGQRDLGIAYLRNAVHLATEQEYWHRRWAAEAALQELGETP